MYLIRNVYGQLNEPKRMGEKQQNIPKQCEKSYDDNRHANKVLKKIDLIECPIECVG